jgi:hypothetical protein
VARNPHSRRSRPRAPASRHGLSNHSPLVGGSLTSDAGAEEPRQSAPQFDARSGELDLPAPGAELPPEPDPR